MKLVMAIMSKEDANIAMDALTEKGIQATKMASTGGFLKSGNTTLIIGIDDEKVDEVIKIISKYSSKRKQLMVPSPAVGFDALSNIPFEVTTGGAIIFVLNVDRFEKV